MRAFAAVFDCLHSQHYPNMIRLVRQLVYGPAMGAARANSIVLRPDLVFNGVRIFSATMFVQRDALGDVVTAWIAANPSLVVTEMVLTQSSDSAFHCVAICVFYYENLEASRTGR